MIPTQKLEEYNLWWTGKPVDPNLALAFKRTQFSAIAPQLEKRFILALVGLRRTGKTTVVYQLIEHLLNKKVAPQHILFFSFDEHLTTLADILEQHREIHTLDYREQRVYVFLDEIQKCSDWEHQLKKYYDLYPKLKFVVSGSESLFLRKKTKETLAGRLFEFSFRPFSFKEYIEFKNIPVEQQKYETIIIPLLRHYVLWGGFPETFHLDSQKEFQEYIRSLVVDKIIYKDIPLLYGIEDPYFLQILLELICTNPGMYIDYQSLSKQLGKDRRVIKDYLIYLQQSFLIRLLGNYRKGSIALLRKRKKAYPTDNGLIYLHKPSQDETFMGSAAETLVANSIQATAFWQNGTEVDFIFQGQPIEVKYQESIRAEDLKGVRAFMRKFNVATGVVITKKTEEVIVEEEGTITLIPLWKWLLK